jgi:hypothetical protein
MAKASMKEAQELAQRSADCSQLLTHLIRCNTAPPRTADEARETLRSILGLGTPPQQPRLRATAVGWYSACVGPVDVFDYEARTFQSVSRVDGVCFTNSTLNGLRAHRDVFDAQYGLAFNRDFLLGQGASPCLDIRADLFREEIQLKHEMYPRRLYNFVPRSLLPFVNIINETFDATHEREWRIARDLTFQHADLRYVFCPESDFALFSGVEVEGGPTLYDLGWLANCEPGATLSRSVQRQ